MANPSHKLLIEKFLDWKKVEKRLAIYKHINTYFPLEQLRQCSNKEPYFCHYLAWRLGTWESENLFKLLDDLLDVGSKIDNWDSKNNITQSCSFDEFWGLIWELQVANYFHNNNLTGVEWLHPGPDMRALIHGKEFFVECTTYRKSYRIEEFIGELFHLIHRGIQVRHRPFLRFKLPDNHQKLDTFLDELFSPYLDQEFLKEKLSDAHQKSPLRLPVPEGATNFFVYLEVDGSVSHNMEQPWGKTGDPNNYLADAIKKAMDNKRDSNDLKNYHPNLLAINFLPGIDYQFAINLDRQIPYPDFGSTFDGVSFTACGIDKLDIFENYFIKVTDDHPFKSFAESINK